MIDIKVDDVVELKTLSCVLNDVNTNEFNELIFENLDISLEQLSDIYPKLDDDSEDEDKVTITYVDSDMDFKIKRFHQTFPNELIYQRINNEKQ